MVPLTAQGSNHAPAGLSNILLIVKRNLISGERGIRTLDTCEGIHAFQACAFSHSAISPKEGVGFEPTVPHNGTFDFESNAFVHSAIPPQKKRRVSMPSATEEFRCQRSLLLACRLSALANCFKEIGQEPRTFIAKTILGYIDPMI